MKRILIIFVLLLGASVSAQEVEIRQNIEGKLTSLTIGSGWEVYLVPHADSSTYISVITNKADLVHQLQDVAVVYEKMLRINDCPALFHGARLEIHSNFPFSQVDMLQATVMGGSLPMPKVSGGAELYLNNSVVRLESLDSKDRVNVNLHGSLLQIDTLQGGSFVVDSKDASQLQIQNYRQKELRIKVYDEKSLENYAFPDSSLMVEVSDETVLDTVNHIYWEDCTRTFMARRPQLVLNIDPYLKIGSGSSDMGWRARTSSAPTNSPFFSDRAVGLRLPMLFTFKIDKDRTLTFKTGLMGQWEVSQLWNPVKVDGNGLLVLDPDPSAAHRELVNTYYLGIPFVLEYRPKGMFGIYSMSVDLFLGRKSNDRIYSYSSNADNTRLVHDDQTADYRNRWKLELGYTFNMPVLSILGNIRFYANLLPEYRKDLGLPKVHTFGLELGL